MNNFYTDSKMYYSEIAIALEDYQPNTICKFRIPAIMPFIDNSVVAKQTNQINNTVSIDNYNKSSIGEPKYNCCNYLELLVPKHIPAGKVGSKFIVTFIGGDIDKCELIREV